MGFNELCQILLKIIAWLYKALTVIGGSCITLIGIYTFYRTFISKKIRFLGIGFFSDLWEGESFNVIVQNWSLSAISIRKVILVVNDDYEVVVKEYPEQFLLEPLKAVRIDSGNMSESLFFDENVFDSNFKLLFYCSDNKVLTTSLKSKKHHKKQKKYRHKMISNFSFNGERLSKNVKYVVSIIAPDGKTFNNLIDKSGNIKEPIAGYNAINCNSIDDENEVTDVLQDLLGIGYTVQLYKITFPSADKSATNA